MSTPNPGAEVPSFLAWPFPHRPTHPGDPIGMEFILDKLAPDTRNQLIAVRLEAVAAVHQAVAGGPGRPPPSSPALMARAVAPEVVLIGYQDQGNLGMGYLAAVLKEQGRTVELIDVRDGPQRSAARLAPTEGGAQPLVVGFSLIFQFFLPQFRRVATELRRVGVTSHFTTGGHCASLCHDELLAQMPELDSVARYEGGHTLVELVDRLAAGTDWRPTPGLAFLSEGKGTESPTRCSLSRQ